MFDGIVMIVVVLFAILFILQAETTPCPPVTVSLSLATTGDVQNLRDTMNCSGGGVFNITWHGSLRVEQTIEVTDHKTVNVTGYGYRPTIGSDLEDANDAGAVVDGEYGSRLFLVSNWSSLTLQNMVLKGGYSNDGGGAVAVEPTSTLNVVGCVFTDNTASVGAGTLFPTVLHNVSIQAINSAVRAVCKGAFEYFNILTGAIYLNSSQVRMDGATYFGNNSADVGGAIYADVGSEIIVEGSTTFAHNSAKYLGGATYVKGVRVDIEGSTNFSNNAAEMGGALYADEGSEIVIDGKTCFTNNSANSSGGAVYAYESGVFLNGEISLADNSAGFRGGALYMFRSEIHTGGATRSDNNEATFGGAIYSFESRVAIEGNTSFVGNGATQDGGAILANYGSLVTFDGDTSFYHNNADSNGGSFFTSRSSIWMDGTIHFVSSSATKYGGAVYSSRSDMSINGTTYFTRSHALSGGAMYTSKSEMNISGVSSFSHNSVNESGGAFLVSRTLAIFDGTTSFYGNSAPLPGGAISTHSSKLVLSGTSNFSENFADFGGAISVQYESELHVDGTTSFSGNVAPTAGGAIFADYDVKVFIDGTTYIYDNLCFGRGGGFAAGESEVYISGNTWFHNNTADDGGALFAHDGTNVYIDGISSFLHNTAVADGGATSSLETSVVNFHGNTLFADNSAYSRGGAIFCKGGDTHIDGDTHFSNNSAYFGVDKRRPALVVTAGAVRQNGGNLVVGGATNFTDNSAFIGGGIYVTEGNLSLAGSSMFTGNGAQFDGGAILMRQPTGVNLFSATFTANMAELGGAIFLESPDLNQRSYESCTFDSNIAVDGGAMYLYGDAGLDAVVGCAFHNNSASASGGAIYVIGNLELNDSRFVANTAVELGTAIASVAEISLVEFARVTFQGNSLRCPFGTYGYGVFNENVSRFESVCTGCSTTTNEVPDGVDISEESGTPACQELPTGAVGVSSGTTVASITLREGYYRTSNSSVDILECHRQEACLGGDGFETYCAAGYEGAYCAVCSNNYSPGMAYSCSECSDGTRASAVGLASTAVVVVLLLTAILLRHFGRVVDDDIGQGTDARRGPCENTCVSMQDTVTRVLPLTAIKIVVVVWQIISQFSAIAGDVYPEEYEVFVSYVSFATFDIGFIMSYSCLIPHDFYSRLLLATITPLVVLVILAVAFYMARRRYACSERKIAVVRSKHISAALFFTFFVYSSVSYTIFQTFICDSLDDGEVYLQADYSLKCSTNRHSAYTLYAALMVAVYPIGIPAVFGWWLVRNRRYLKGSERQMMARLQPFSCLWETYKPSRYYYEVVECFRRVSLTMASAFLIPNSVNQIAVVLLVAVVFLFVSESMSPFAGNIDMSLYRWGNGVILSSMYVALLMKANQFNEESEVLPVFGGVLISANLFMIVAVLVQTMLLAKAWRGFKPAVELISPPVRRSASVVLRAIKGGQGSAEHDWLEEM